jgi:hypothetical protein
LSPWLLLLPSLCNCVVLSSPTTVVVAVAAIITFVAQLLPPSLSPGFMVIFTLVRALSDLWYL